MDKQDLDEFIELMETLRAGVVGYRRKLIDGGFPEEEAGDMAHDFHSFLLGRMAAQYNFTFLPALTMSLPLSDDDD